MPEARSLSQLIRGFLMECFPPGWGPSQRGAAVRSCSDCLNTLAALESLQMSANCGDYGERRGVGICNEFPIAFKPRILWFCASAPKAESIRRVWTKVTRWIGHWLLDGQPLEHQAQPNWVHLFFQLCSLLTQCNIYFLSSSLPSPFLSEDDLNNPVPLDHDKIW